MIDLSFTKPANYSYYNGLTSAYFLNFILGPHFVLRHLLSRMFSKTQLNRETNKPACRF